MKPEEQKVLTAGLESANEIIKAIGSKYNCGSFPGVNDFGKDKRSIDAAWTVYFEPKERDGSWLWWTIYCQMLPKGNKIDAYIKYESSMDSIGGKSLLGKWKKAKFVNVDPTDIGECIFSCVVKWNAGSDEMMNDPKFKNYRGRMLGADLGIIESFTEFLSNLDY